MKTQQRFSRTAADSMHQSGSSNRHSKSQQRQRKVTGPESLRCPYMKVAADTPAEIVAPEACSRWYKEQAQEISCQHGIPTSSTESGGAEDQNATADIVLLTGQIVSADRELTGGSAVKKKEAHDFGSLRLCAISTLQKEIA